MMKMLMLVTDALALLQNQPSGTWPYAIRLYNPVTYS